MSKIKDIHVNFNGTSVTLAPAGEKSAIGKVGPWPVQSPEYMGGADQIIIIKYDYPENVWVEKIKDFKTGKIYSYGDFCLQFPNLCVK